MESYLLLRDSIGASAVSPSRRTAKKGGSLYRWNLLQTFYCDKREFTGVIVVSGVSPSVSFADSSLVRGSLELPPSDEGGGATEKRCLSVASEGEITVNNHLPFQRKEAANENS